MLVSIYFKCKLIRIWSFHFIVRIQYSDLIVWINSSHVIVRIGRNNYVYKWIPSQWRCCWTNRHIPLVESLFFLSFHQRQQIMICLVFFPGSLFGRQYTYLYISPQNTTSLYDYLIRTRIYPLFDYLNSTLQTCTSFDCMNS